MLSFQSLISCLPFPATTLIIGSSIMVCPASGVYLLVILFGIHCFTFNNLFFALIITAIPIPANNPTVAPTIPPTPTPNVVTLKSTRGSNFFSLFYIFSIAPTMARVPVAAAPIQAPIAVLSSTILS